MIIYNGSLRITSTPDSITLADSVQRVVLRKNESGMWDYFSQREGEVSPEKAPSDAPLCEHWHHAMVFFGVIEPDEISHPN